MNNWAKIWSNLAPFFKMIMVLVIGHILIKYLLKIIKRGLSRTKPDESLQRFIIKTLNIVFHLLIFMSALNCIGISTTGILAGLSAAALAVAVALKDSLSNVAGGILLLISPRFSTGDFIEASGNSGVVLSVDLMHTLVKTADGKQVSIPNGVLINNQIINYSREPMRRVDITFSIAYDNDAEKAKSVILEVIGKHELVSNTPELPTARVISYGDSAVNIISRCWCNNQDYWTVFFDLNEQIRYALEKAGITIPFNQLDVHIRQ